jgi:uncharacterized protein YqeY
MGGAHPRRHSVAARRTRSTFSRYTRPGQTGLVTAELPERLRAGLTQAIKSRNLDAVRALRSALAAIENAGAVDPGQAPNPDGHPHLAGSVSGLAAAEVRRRQLNPAELTTIVHREVTDRLAAATEYEQAGRGQRAASLRAEAAALTPFVPNDHPNDHPNEPTATGPAAGNEPR